MGGVCTRGMVERNPVIPTKNLGSDEHSKKLKTMKSIGKKMEESDPISGDLDSDLMPVYERGPREFDSCELRLSEPCKLRAPSRAVASKVPEIGSLLGRAGIVGLERAVDVLDTLGSSMSNLNPSGGFVSGMAARGNKISIRAFEVANTIAKGANLLQSLSEENIQFLKEEILHSDGVQRLVSTNMEELLSIAASDKREELNVFSREVSRFGDLCKDAQWHNLSRYFQKLDSDLTAQKMVREETEATMQQLTNWAQLTSELYHELNALDRFEQDYRRKVQEEESLQVTRRGENLTVLHSELKRQRKLVKGLQKKSLWSKNLEEVMEKLVDIVTFLHQEINGAFANNGTKLVDKRIYPQRLGVLGLSLHYANLINQIDNTVSRPCSIPPNTRDTLYNGLPSDVKVALRSRLQSFQAKEELTIPQIKAEMEKTLQWIVPIATNTTRAHQGFGWVGEWANTGIEFHKKTSPQSNMIRIQTLYHAQKEKTDEYILELVTWLHHLVIQVKSRDHRFKSLVPFRSPAQKGSPLSPETLRYPSLTCNNKTKISQLSQEDREMLQEVIYRKLIPGISKSQEFVISKKKGSKDLGLSRSSGSSPTKKSSERIKVLDAMDGLDAPETSPAL
ncbi:protein PSK SIMULATOR 2-like isoform X2 [Tasmannia lanceolata]|uniref:protein PSK SIMULATOR 2-like isoform X2 n=1 Tax=Tasmannia lanceolata TaxID=3420 RepID=UPI0040640632